MDAIKMGKNPKHKAKATLPSNLGKVSAKKLGTKHIGRKCNVAGCSKESIHSLSKMEYESALKTANLDVVFHKGMRKFNICKEHYKALKAAKKKEDKKVKPKFDSKLANSKSPAKRLKI